MKARLPQSAQPQSMNQMIKQAQKMQEEMQTAQAALDEKTYAGAAGGGKVEVSVTGKKQVVSVKIDPAVVDPEDVEFLQDMVASAVNEAVKAAEDDAAAVMGKITGPMGMGL